jgi:hypothetical protein
VLGSAAPVATRAAEEPLEADAWITRTRGALAPSPMSGRADVHVRDARGREFDFTVEWLRPVVDASGRRTLFEMREPGTPESVVSQLVEAPGEPLVNWVFDLQSRRFVRYRGLLATDRFAGTLFRFEDLALADPEGRRGGEARWHESGGRRLVRLESGPYHYYARVVTFIDPASALPVRVEFYDHTGTRIREESFEEVREWNGRPFPSRLLARDLVTGEETSLTVKQVLFAPVRDSSLDLGLISDRLRRGLDPVPVP